MKYRFASAAGVCAALALCAPALASAATVQISITDDIFTPKTVSINAGDTIIWTNNGRMAHTVTADDGSFDSGSIAPGVSYVHIYNTPGTFAYHCAFHGGVGGVGMAGSVTVVATTVAQPTTTTTQTSPSSYDQQVATLRSEVQVLTQVLTNLLAARGSGVPGTSSQTVGSACYAITPMGPGASGNGVSQLQQFLARDAALYPEDKITGFYGPLTQAAVQRFQTKNVIVNSGDPATTGYGAVGPKTLAAIQAQCGSATGTAVGGTTIQPTGPVGGFIQVSPVSGNAPLQVAVQASVNTTNDCSGATYRLDFGDGSQQQSITVSPGACQTLQQSYTHTYASRGTFTVVLSAGTHQTSATVVVQ